MYRDSPVDSFVPLLVVRLGLHLSRNSCLISPTQTLVTNASTSSLGAYLAQFHSHSLWTSEDPSARSIGAEGDLLRLQIIPTTVEKPSSDDIKQTMPQQYIV